MEEPYSLQKDDIEGFKLIFDFLKHLTTLSSGSILLLLALAEKFFANSPLRNALFQALVAFGCSILTALLSMAIVSFTVGSGTFSAKARKVFAWGYSMSALGFFGGMLLVIIAVVRQYG